MTGRDGRVDEPAASSLIISSSSRISRFIMLSLGTDVGLGKEENSVALTLLGLHSADKEVRGDCKNSCCFLLLSLTSACHCLIILAICSSSTLLLKLDPICEQTLAICYICAKCQESVLHKYQHGIYF